jgi:histone H1/5
MNDETATTGGEASEATATKAKSKKPAAAKEKVAKPAATKNGTTKDAKKPSKATSTKPAGKAKKEGKKSAAKPAKEKAAKSASKANGKANGKAAPEKSGDYNAAEAFARKVAKEYGSVTVVRATAQKFPKMKRSEMMDILVNKLGVNKFTASRQFHTARSGEVEVDLSAL